MWRFPVWKRTIVMSAGSVTHFTARHRDLWGAVGLRRRCPTRTRPTRPRRWSTHDACRASPLDWCVTRRARGQQAVRQGHGPGQRRRPRPACGPATRSSRSTARRSPPGAQLTETVRGRRRQAVTVDLRARRRRPTTPAVTCRWPSGVKLTSTRTPAASTARSADLERVGQLGITPAVRARPRPVAAFGAGQGQHTGDVRRARSPRCKRFPEKVPEAVGRDHRRRARPGDPDQRGRRQPDRRRAVRARATGPTFLLLLAGAELLRRHVQPAAAAARWTAGTSPSPGSRGSASWLYARLGKPDPGRVDYFKLMPRDVRGDPDLRRVHPAHRHRRHRQPDHALLR